MPTKGASGVVHSTNCGGIPSQTLGFMTGWLEKKRAASGVSLTRVDVNSLPWSHLLPHLNFQIPLTPSELSQSKPPTAAVAITGDSA